MQLSTSVFLLTFQLDVYGHELDLAEGLSDEYWRGTEKFIKPRKSSFKFWWIDEWAKFSLIYRFSYLFLM